MEYILIPLAITGGMAGIAAAIESLRTSWNPFSKKFEPVLVDKEKVGMAAGIGAGVGGAISVAALVALAVSTKIEPANNEAVSGMRYTENPMRAKRMYPGQGYDME